MFNVEYERALILELEDSKSAYFYKEKLWTFFLGRTQQIIFQIARSCQISSNVQ